ncbi:MAG: CHAP domain-containing protein [Erysipelotrichaceae bacterium]|nr:CHAP domain-containing protein [Erysipelotrichaceae bacterium]
MKILLVILLLLLNGCSRKPAPLIYEEAIKHTNTAEAKIVITDKDIDEFNESSNYGMDNEYAQAIAACFYHDYKKNISSSLPDFSLIMNGKTLDECLYLAKNRYKYLLVEYRREVIESLLDYYRCRNRLLEYSDIHRIIPCEYDNLDVKLDSAEAEEIWEKYRTIGGGNGFYYVNKRRYWQCTTFAWARFYEVYGYDSGAVGDGCFHAIEVVRAHPTRFMISTTPAPGATFSKWLTPTNHAGHTGFVEAVEGDYMWISEGNYDSAGGIRYNYKVKISDFSRRYPNTIYAIPVRY